MFVNLHAALIWCSIECSDVTVHTAAGT